MCKERFKWIIAACIPVYYLSKGWEVSGNSKEIKFKWIGTPPPPPPEKIQLCVKSSSSFCIMSIN